MEVGWATWGSSLLQSPKGTQLLPSQMPKGANRANLSGKQRLLSGSGARERKERRQMTRRPSQSWAKRHQSLRPPGMKWRVLSSFCHCLPASFPLPLTHSIGPFFLCLLRVTSKHDNSEMMNWVLLRTVYLYQQSCYYIKYIYQIHQG